MEMVFIVQHFSPNLLEIHCTMLACQKVCSSIFYVYFLVTITLFQNSILFLRLKDRVFSSKYDHLFYKLDLVFSYGYFCKMKLEF